MKKSRRKAKIEMTGRYGTAYGQIGTEELKDWLYTHLNGNNFNGRPRPTQDSKAHDLFYGRWNCYEWIIVL